MMQGMRASMVLLLICLYGCAGNPAPQQAAQQPTAIPDEVKLQCERMALMAQQQAVNQVRIDSASSASSGSRSQSAMRSSDEGKRAYDVVMRECLQRLQTDSSRN